jgi:predicted nucleic acid-binding protein
MLELGFMARSAAEHNEITTELIDRMDLLSLAPEITGIACDLQRRLFDAGMGRSTGPFDLTVAAHAIHHSNETTEVVVVHYDSDYDHVGRVAPELHAEWVVPRGTID